MTEGLLRSIYRGLMPVAVRKSLAAYRTLAFRLGHLRSLRESACVAADGSPLPWYTYPAIDYLEQLDLSALSVFEFGSGNSTRYWARRCKTLVSVEDNREWYDKVKPTLPANVEYRFEQGSEEYAGAIQRFPHKFDIIAIDGNYRLECARVALRHLSPGGFIILDNSDWHERSAAVLLGSDLLHVSMSGFGPLLAHTWATSFYFTRDYRPKPRFDRHPAYGTGSHIRTEAQQRGEL